MTTPTLVRLTAISKAFAGVHALRGVGFELLEGEVHALVGENGAGKSTLIRVITGAHRPDEGTLEIRGREIIDNNPVRARTLGIAAIRLSQVDRSNIGAPCTRRSRRLPIANMIGEIIRIANAPTLKS